jgi:hypothetical protein
MLLARTLTHAAANSGPSRAPVADHPSLHVYP